MKRLLATVAAAAALVVSAMPAHAAPIVRTQECPPGMVGRIIYIGDNIATYNCYRLP